MKRAGLVMILAGLALAASSALAADGPVTAWRKAHEREILGQFETLLSMPNVATKPADIAANADYLIAELKARGFTARTLDDGQGAPPAVFGELKAPGARRTVVFYAHYDGQPAGQPEWTSDPWKPVMREAGPASANPASVDWRKAAAIDPEWRLYARSASDDKAPIQALFSALDALKAQGRAPAINIKVFWEGEEEQGSGHLDAILERHKALLAGDLFILGDGPVHQSGRPTLFFGARGVTGVDLTVYGPARPLHSGHYGNWAPNPGVALAGLVAKLRDDDGQILIPGFYDDVRPLSGAERAALAALPDVETDLRRDLAIGRSEGRERLADSISRPALNLRGLWMGDVGDAASNAIFPEAHASIDFRLVPDQTPERIKARMEAYLSSLGWHVVHETPSPETRRAHGRIVKLDWSLDYPAYRTGMDGDAATAVARVVERAVGAPVLKLPMLGGSVPMHTFDRRLAMPIVGLPIANPDNNQHAANENLRLANLWTAIDVYAAMLTDLDW